MAQAHAIPILRVAGGAALVDLLTCRHVGRSGRVARGRIHDEQRVDYLRTHFEATLDAMERGADVRGYFVWSLLDNFEWGYGYSKRFGIIRVDYTTLERTWKDSAHWYAEVIRTDSVPATELAPQLG